MPDSIELRQPTYPVPPAARSYWLADAIATRPEPTLPALEGSVQADVCVVGGGFTGLWTAIETRRRNPSLDVVLIEADICGGGASGANAGYLMNVWPKFLALRSQMAMDEAVWVARRVEEDVAGIAEVCVAEQIDAQLQRHGVLWAATNTAQAGAWRETLDALESVAGSPLREISREEARELARSPVVEGGVIDDTCLAVQPARLALGLRDLVTRAGIPIYERTPAVAIDRIGRGARVRTPSGAVDCTSVALAVNAWAVRLPGAADRLAIVASDTLVTEPAPDLADMPATYDSRRRLNYLRSTADGRAVFGKGGVSVARGSRAVDGMWGNADLQTLTRHLARTVPALAESRVVSAWRAPVEYSSTSLPFCGQLPGLPAWYATGYSGDGLGPSRLVARILASLVTGARDEWSSCTLARPPAARLPREPLRSFGGRIVTAALARTEDAEDRGATASRLVRRVAAIDPTSFAG